MSPPQPKTRQCRAFHGVTYFKPSGIPLRDLSVHTLYLDELEALHLCDHEALSQEAAAKAMQISTSTLQRLLYAGRKKVVAALYESKAIEILRHENLIENEDR